MNSKANLFKALSSDGIDVSSALTRTAVAADLQGVMASCGLNQSQLAGRLGWSRARVSQVFSGDENLTLDTIGHVAKACGQSFDVVFRDEQARRIAQRWEKSKPQVVVCNDVKKSLFKGRLTVQLPLSPKLELPSSVFRFERIQQKIGFQESYENAA